MSAVTLETLRADFDALVQHYWPRSAGLQPEHVDRNGERTLADFSDPDTSKRIRRVMVAARAYLVARDYGLEAAMLYKLSDGAMDPRKTGEA